MNYSSMIWLFLCIPDAHEKYAVEAEKEDPDAARPAATDVMNVFALLMAIVASCFNILKYALFYDYVYKVCQLLAVGNGERG